jgi:cytosolic prostaglandin-E synthase
MDITNEKIELTSTHLQFTGDSAGKSYSVNIELFD